MKATKSNENPLVVNCPTCKTKVTWVEANQDRPFCSKRCKLIDLGEWASESFRIPETRPTAMDEFDIEEMERHLTENTIEAEDNDTPSTPHRGWLQ